MLQITRLQVDSTGRGNVDLDLKLDQESWVSACFVQPSFHNLMH